MCWLGLEIQDGFEILANSLTHVTLASTKIEYLTICEMYFVIKE